MWHKLTVEQYQQINAFQSSDIDPVDKVVQTIAIAYDMTDEEVNNLPVNVFNQYAKEVGESLTTPDFTKRAKRFIKANGNRYRLFYDAGAIRFGQYIELQHFIRGGIIENLHLIAASISARTRFFFWTAENESETHEDRAKDFLQANFRDLYCSVVFFCSELASFNKRYNPPKQQDEDEEEEISPFIQQYGWIYSATQVAKHEGITLDKAFDLKTTQALNDLYYIKQYNDYQMELNEKAKKGVSHAV